MSSRRALHSRPLRFAASPEHRTNAFTDERFAPNEQHTTNNEPLAPPCPRSLRRTVALVIVPAVVVRSPRRRRASHKYAPMTSPVLRCACRLCRRRGTCVFGGVRPGLHDRPNWEPSRESTTSGTTTKPPPDGQVRLLARRVLRTLAVTTWCHSPPALLTWHRTSPRRPRLRCFSDHGHANRRHVHCLARVLAAHVQQVIQGNQLTLGRCCRRGGLTLVSNKRPSSAGLSSASPASAEAPFALVGTSRCVRHGGPSPAYSWR